MNFFSLVSALVTCGVLAAALYEWLCRFSERSPSDVLPFLQKIDLEVMYGTFHPEAEEVLRRRLPPNEFRQIQWKRFHLAIHYCLLLAANSRVLQGWARYGKRNDWLNLGADLQSTVTELRHKCMQCRLAAWVIRLRLRWWLARMRLFPWAPVPTFSTLVQLGSADMVAFYDKIRETAELFSVAYGEDYHQKLMQVL